MCAQNMCIYICVARKNVLAAPNCNKKQLIGKNKTFLHDVYEKAFFSKIISFYIKRRRTFFIEKKAKLRAIPCSSPFLLPFFAPPLAPSRLPSKIYQEIQNQL